MPPMTSIESVADVVGMRELVGLIVPKIDPVTRGPGSAVRLP